MLLVALVVAALTVMPVFVFAQPYVATTTVRLSVCGDGILDGPEFCDDGTNSGLYASSIATRNCTPDCRGWGQYCGDGAINFDDGERCDDGNNMNGDLCDATCQNEQDPVTEGGSSSGGSAGGGGGRSSGGDDGIPGASEEGGINFEGDTDIIIRGMAYPRARITLLRDGDIDSVFEADSSGEFEYTLSEQTPGITTFGFWAQDQADRRSITYTATFQVIQNAVTTLTGILIPPTIAVVPEKIPPGETAVFEGTAAPNATLQAYVDNGEDPEVTIAANDGVWSMVHDTTGLAVEQFHTVKANYFLPDDDELKSGFSTLVSYYVGNADVDTSFLSADLNRDTFVNLADFSILLFNWNTTNAVADIDQNGQVGLSDFSIMLFYWTG